MAGKPFLPIVLLLITGFLPSLSSAREDVRGVKVTPPELKVIDEKCLTCHNRKRIDDAVKERRDMEKVLSVMEKKGVVLTESDRSVIGHFWQQKLFKEKKGEGSAH
ncbi:MAG TPA: hypothetical protein VK187_15185 [Geobacteraceae bacterium]|nr:hypothetical protein [Geobacteraceae bacterium]